MPTKRKNELPKRSHRQPRGFNAVEDSEHYVAHWRKARGGDRASARYLLRTFCVSVDDGKGVPKPILAYLQSAITRYLHGQTTLEKALGVSPPPHRGKGTHGRLTDPERLAARFFLYRARDRMKITEAKEEVANECSTTCRTVEHAVNANAEFQFLSVRELEALIAP